MLKFRFSTPGGTASVIVTQDAPQDSWYTMRALAGRELGVDCFLLQTERLDEGKSMLAEHRKMWGGRIPKGAVSKTAAP